MDRMRAKKNSEYNFNKSLLWANTHNRITLGEFEIELISPIDPLRLLESFNFDELELTGRKSKKKEHVRI
jgi:hypothetical protein